MADIIDKKILPVLTVISLPAPKDDEEYVLRKIALTPSQLLIIEQDKLQIELDSMNEPDDKELIEIGKMTHPYYMDLMRLEQLKEELK
jgi:hypothetical protein